MRTVLTKDPRKAAEFIRRGETVAFPTETVYGLGANIFDEAAIRKIFEAKQRPSDNPLIAHVARVEDVSAVASEVNEAARKFIEAFFPGALTVVLRRRFEIPAIAAAGLDTIGVRMPRHPLANEFIKLCGAPVVAPSANISGRPSPTEWRAVYEDLNGRITCILQGAATEIGLESTVLDCTTDAPLVLRAGGVALEALQEIVPTTRLANIASTDEPARSPGMRHRHYAPRARIRLIENSNEITAYERAAFIGLHAPQDLKRFALHQICVSVEEYARELFRFFRACDAAQVETIYCETVSETGLGGALMERLRRAAEK